MSKAGQSTFTGISNQADVTLYYLLKSSGEPGFSRATIEHPNYEDFTLVFGDVCQHFEVKWYARALNWAVVKGIIGKELAKVFNEGDSFTIAARAFSRPTLTDYRSLKDSFLFEGDSHPIAISLSEKGWTKEEIRFLFELTTLAEIPNVRQRIDDHFASEEPYFLSEYDVESLASRFFRRILELGSSGEAITKEEVRRGIREFVESAAELSESFNPSFHRADRVIKLEPYIASEKKFAQLNSRAFLGPISADRRLVFYLANRILGNDFSFETVLFYLTEILLRADYPFTALRILEAKWQRGIALPSTAITFLTSNFERFDLREQNSHVLGMMHCFAKETGEEDEDILGFLGCILPRLGREGDPRFLSRGEPALILEVLFERQPDRVVKDIILKHYDFTGDAFDGLPTTNPKIYRILVDWTLLDFAKRYPLVKDLVVSQFSRKYGGFFKGVDSGGSYSSSGHQHSMTDLGAVRQLFRPMFEEHYSCNKQGWEDIKREILEKAPKRPTSKNPLFLKRAAIGILLDRARGDAGRAGQREAIGYLRSLLELRRYEISAAVFSMLKETDLASVGKGRVLSLVVADSTSKRRSDLPLTLYTLEVLILLIRLRYGPARTYFISLLQNRQFLERDHSEYEFIELLQEHGIPEADPGFVFRVLGILKLESYLDHIAAWDKGIVLVGLLRYDLQTESDRAVRFARALLRTESASCKRFVERAFVALEEAEPELVYRVVQPFLRSEEIFRATIPPEFRERFPWLGKSLANSQCLPEAMEILNLCLCDPDQKVKDATLGALEPFATSSSSDSIAYAAEAVLNHYPPTSLPTWNAVIPIQYLLASRRRAVLNEHTPGLGNRIRQWYLDSLRMASRLKHTSGAHTHLSIRLSDVSTAEAHEILDYALQVDLKIAANRAVYFSELRTRVYPQILFDPEPFRSTLMHMCSSEDIPTRRVAASEVSSYCTSERKGDFFRLKPYWLQLFEPYDPQIYKDLYHDLSILLTWPESYDEAIDLFRGALRTEARNNALGLVGDGDAAFKIIKEKDASDFLNTLDLLTEVLSEDVRYTGQHHFKSWMTETHAATTEQRVCHERILERLKDLLPETFVGGL